MLSRVLAVLIIFLAADVSLAGLLHHRIRVELDPLGGSLKAVDEVTLAGQTAEKPWIFLIHKGLNPSSLTAARLEKLPASSEIPELAEGYLVTVPPGEDSIKIAYEGRIVHEPTPEGREYARGFSSTPGTISGEGVMLSSSAFWLPLFPDAPFSFTLTSVTPEGWETVSQGARTAREAAGGKVTTVYESAAPSEEAYLIAAPYHVYESSKNGKTAQSYLRTPDAPLAAKYLEATHQYLAMYEELIGPYPYGKFALVENFWETGFGMPSFTLLGPKVLRFPFILRSSYPHEVLHNWWGNGVYVDYQGGNWAEGLTAYLADHLMREQAGLGHEMREATLQKYADYVAERADAPLSSFVSRHDSASEALGYGKSEMVFHMLRRLVGDDAFRNGLRLFYKDNLWKKAGWSDLEAAFEKASSRDLSRFFEEWVKRPGAVKLGLSSARVEEGASGWLVKGTLTQENAPPYALSVPLALTLKGVDEARVVNVELDGAEVKFSIEAKEKPLALAVDPAYDLFRHLKSSEIPAALSGAFGSPRNLFVLPSKAPPPLYAAYRAFAEGLSGNWEGLSSVADDDKLEALPTEGGVWVLGWENLHLPKVAEALKNQPVTLGESEVALGVSTVPRGSSSVVATAGLPGGERAQLTFLGTANPKALPGLGRKLPHYHKYSYLAFEGDAPDNIVKGRWEPTGGGLQIRFEEGAHFAPLPKAVPLGELPQPFSIARMTGVIGELASPRFQGRGAGTEGLLLAADYLGERMAALGLLPGGENNSYFGTFKAKTGPRGEETALRNVIAVIPGSHPSLKEEAIVVGAHYDHLGFGWPDVRQGSEGKLHPGADDNGSGVAVMLELAAKLAGAKPDRTLLFVAFAGEEAGRLGSLAFLNERQGWPPEKIRAMVNLDTVGRLFDGRILVLGAQSAREWIHIFNGAAFVTGAKVESVMKDYGSSDQASFIAAGIPAVQLFTGAHREYHSPSDTPEKIDPRGLASVAAVAHEAVSYLSKAEASLTVAIPGAAKGGSAPAVEPGKRRVFLGTVPDFAFQGEGVRVDSVEEGSPAALSGLRAGDVVIGLNGDKVEGLKGYSELLKKFSPGDNVKVLYKRGAEVLEAQATLSAR